MWDISKPDNLEEEKEESILYNHEDFCEFLQIFRKGKPTLPKWKSYPLWIISYIPFTFFVLSIITTIAIAISCGSSRPRRKYPEDTHRMVVKEGILWDSVEYHER